MPFPNSPSTGDTTTIGTSTYRYNGYAWVRIGTIVGFTGPQGPTGSAGADGLSGTAGTAFSPQLLSIQATGAAFQPYNVGNQTDHQYSGMTTDPGGTNDFAATGLTANYSEGSFTIKQDGFYSLVASHHWFNNTTARTFTDVFIKKNGNKLPTLAGGYIRDASSQEEMTASVTRFDRLSDGDVITFGFNNTGNSSSAHYLRDSNFQIVRLF